MFTTLINKLIFNEHKYSKSELEPMLKLTNFIETKNYKIPYLFIKYSKEDNLNCPRKLIIYSHGNSYDIYKSRVLMNKLSNELKTDIIIYDYCKFGAHQFADQVEPTEQNMCQDLDSVIKVALENYEIKNIYLLGHSMGSGPSVKLAKKYPEIGGLILFAAFTSVFAVAFGDIPFTDLDLFNNKETIKELVCKILIVHCTGDHIVPVKHAKILINNAQHNMEHGIEKTVYYLIEENGDHNTFSPNILKAINEFLLL